MKQVSLGFVKLRFAQEKSRKSLIQRWATQLEVLRTDSYSILRAVLTRSALIVDDIWNSRKEGSLFCTNGNFFSRDACPPIITIGGGGGKWFVMESNGVELK